MTRLVQVSAAALVCVAVAGCGPLPANVDPLNPGPPDRVGLPVLSFQWKFAMADRLQETKPQEFSSPAFGEEALYVGSREGTFYALSQRRGTPIWQVELGSVSSRPLVDRDRIYVGTDDGTVVCLDAFDGSEIWRYVTRGPILQPPVLDGDTLYVSNEADQVYALDRDSGKYRWQYKGDSPDEFTLRGHAGVVVDDGLVFTGFANGSMVALRANTGSVAWMTSLKGDADRFVDVDTTPLVEGDMVYVASAAGGLYALDKTTGFIRWRTPIEKIGGIVSDGERLYVVAADEGVFALDLEGNVLWRQGTRGGGEPAEPQVSGDYLLYTLSSDGLFVADKRTGKLHQYFNPGHGVSSPPTLAADRLYLVSNRAVLYALNLQRF